ncbi:MAG: HINT domain-containing protein, partial [Bacteroidales bacterium]|nr:HINT domain-containing protein [Bacteroidales bacterium]
VCEDGSTVLVEAVVDTGTVEVVYNLRVADWHTYFVGGEDWGFSVWAHNEYSVQYIEEGGYTGPVIQRFDDWRVIPGANRQPSADRVVQYADASGVFAFRKDFDAREVARHQANYEAKHHTGTEPGDRLERRVAASLGRQVTRVAEVIMGLDASIKGEIDIQTAKNLYEVGTSFEGKLDQLIRLCVVARVRGQSQTVIGVYQDYNPGRFEGYMQHLNALRFDSPAIVAQLRQLVSNPEAYIDDTPLTRYFEGFQRFP